MSNQPLQLSTFQVILNNSQIIIEPIENINQLGEIIHIYGRKVIAKIIFYFYDSHHKYHDLSLVKNEDNDYFNVEFYHYYTSQNGRSPLTLIEKVNDYNIVLQSFDDTELINSLKNYIISPF